MNFSEGVRANYDKISNSSLDLPKFFAEIQSDSKNYDVPLNEKLINNKVLEPWIEESKYIGRATECKGGLAKRLTDYVRDDDSARRSDSGRNMYKYKDIIDIEVIEVGNDMNAVYITKRLEVEMIEKYRPKWNKQHK